MLAAVLTDHEFALVAPSRGQFPAQALVLGPVGWARVDLLPVVVLAAAEGMPADVAERAVTLVQRHRDALLSAWAAIPASLPVGAPDGPRANGVAFDPARKAIAIRLQGGAVLTFPASMIPGLAEADPTAAADITIAAAGEVLAWRKLGLFARVPDLVIATTGGPAWRDRLTTVSVPPWLSPPPYTFQNPAVPPPMDKPMAPAPGMVKSLIGLILQRENYLTAEELQVIFKRQMHLKQAGRDLTFGQVAIESGLLSPERLQFAVHLQSRLAHGPDGGKPLGVYLLESAAIVPSHLLAALDEQKSNGGRLGEILITRGLISRELLDGFLDRQRQVRGAASSAVPAAETEPPAPQPDAASNGAEPDGAVAEAPPAPVPLAVPVAPPEHVKVKSLLGIILEREGYVSQLQVRAIMAEQELLKAAGKGATFGEVALNLNLMTTDQLKFAVGLQKRLAYDPGKPKPLGLILLENGVAKPSQIHLALEEQSRTGRRIGEILVEQEVISDSMLDVFLQMQKQQQ